MTSRTQHGDPLFPKLIFTYFPLMNNSGKFKEISSNKFLLYHTSFNARKEDILPEIVSIFIHVFDIGRASISLIFLDVTIILISGIMIADPLQNLKNASKVYLSFSSIYRLR